MLTRCSKCGDFADRLGQCQSCRERDVMASTPSVAIPEGLFAEGLFAEVWVEAGPGKPDIQPMTLEQAETVGLILTSKSGYDTLVYLRSSKVRLVLKQK